MWLSYNEIYSLSLTLSLSICFLNNEIHTNNCLDSFLFLQMQFAGSGPSFATQYSSLVCGLCCFLLLCDNLTCLLINCFFRTLICVSSFRTHLYYIDVRRVSNLTVYCRIRESKNSMRYHSHCQYHWYVSHSALALLLWSTFNVQMDRKHRIHSFSIRQHIFFKYLFSCTKDTH